jgi:hypothetical protein
MHFYNFSCISELLNIAPDRIVRHFYLATQIRAQYFVMQIYLVKNEGLSLNFQHSFLFVG